MSVLPKSAKGIVHVVTRKLGQTSKGNMRRLGTDNQRQKYVKKIHILLRILAVIGRCMWISFNDCDIFDPK